MQVLQLVVSQSAVHVDSLNLAAAQHTLHELRKVVMRGAEGRIQYGVASAADINQLYPGIRC